MTHPRENTHPYPHPQVTLWQTLTEEQKEKFERKAGKANVANRAAAAGGVGVVVVGGGGGESAGKPVKTSAKEKLFSKKKADIVKSQRFMLTETYVAKFVG